MDYTGTRAEPARSEGKRWKLDLEKLKRTFGKMAAALLMSGLRASVIQLAERWLISGSPVYVWDCLGIGTM